MWNWFILRHWRLWLLINLEQVDTIWLFKSFSRINSIWVDFIQIFCSPGMIWHLNKLVISSTTLIRFYFRRSKHFVFQDTILLSEATLALTVLLVLTDAKRLGRYWWQLKFFALEGKGTFHAWSVKSLCLVIAFVMFKELFDVYKFVLILHIF